MDERLHPTFSKKSGLGITKTYRGIILTAIIAKFYNAMLQTWNRENSLEKSGQLSEKPIHNFPDSDYPPK